ncbi:MAG: transposase [Pirellulaceae bacterium]
MGSKLWPLQTFDPQADFNIVERKLPHWSQAGCLCFITWRTVDSIPQAVLNRWHADREAWLRQHGIELKQENWKSQLLQLDQRLRAEFTQTFSERWHQQLDSSHGACVFRDPSLSKIVADSLHKFDGERYQLTDFVVMPNHVHLLVAFADEDGMLSQCDSWKHFTARELNQRLGTKGRFWQQDGFDHLVRTEEHFEAFRRYIANNPGKAHLKSGESVHFSKDLNGLM